MAPFSTYPAAKAAILAMLQASPELAGVPVVWGIPPTMPSRDWVTLGDMNGTQSPVVIANGKLPRDEDYTIEVSFISARGAGGQQAATEAVFDLSRALEQGLRADPDLGGIVHWTGVDSMSVDERLADDGQATAVLVVSVSIRARVEGA